MNALQNYLRRLFRRETGDEMRARVKAALAADREHLALSLIIHSTQDTSPRSSK
jgi:hypothetical protein